MNEKDIEILKTILACKIIKDLQELDISRIANQIEYNEECGYFIVKIITKYSREDIKNIRHNI